MRVFAVSDIHTDYPANMAWLEQTCQSAEFKQDALVVAGDISDDLPTFTRTLELLTRAWGEVFVTPGNHDLWCRKAERDQYDSLQKLELLLSVCKRLGVHTAPRRLESRGGGTAVWVVPLLSWYHGSWDREPDVPGALPIDKVMLDFYVCRWTSAPALSPKDDSLARHFDCLNDPAFEQALAAIQAEEAASGVRPAVLSASHFLPRQDLLPEKRMLHHPNLAKAAGSDFLRARVERLRPLAHVFGHTHFTWDASHGGVRYVQWPLGYPHEQARRRSAGAGWEPLLLYDSSKASAAAGAAAGAGSGGSGGTPRQRPNPGEGLSPQRSAYWSDYYAAVPRDPGNVSPAPWVNLAGR